MYDERVRRVPCRGPIRQSGAGDTRNAWAVGAARRGAVGRTLVYRQFTVARRLAVTVRARYLDIGAMCRVVALAVPRAGVDLDDSAAIAAVAKANVPAIGIEQLTVGGQVVQSVGRVVKRPADQAGCAGRSRAGCGPPRSGADRTGSCVCFDTGRGGLATGRYGPGRVRPRCADVTPRAPRESAGVPAVRPVVARRDGCSRCDQHGWWCTAPAVGRPRKPLRETALSCPSAMGSSRCSGSSAIHQRRRA